MDKNTNSRIQNTFNSGDYKECITVCDSILSSDSNHPQANFFKGASLVRLKDYGKAEMYLESAKSNNFQPAVFVNTSLLRLHAGLKHSDKVLEQLSDMVDNGFGLLTVLNAEEFNFLKEDEQFAALKTKVDANANPCKYGKAYKKLDFWLGEWDVYVNGKKTADSYITKSKGGCTLHEDYQTLSGYYGRSINYLDTADNLYTQIWIDKSNSKIEFKETEAREGYLMMLSDSDKNNLIRMSYEKDPKTGHVTQIMESSSDDGKTWNLDFLGVYKLKHTN